MTIVAHDIGPVRGMERQLSELVIGLGRLGHRVTVIARTCQLPPTMGVAGAGDAGPGVAFHRVKGPSRPFVIAYPWFMVAGSLALRRWRRGVVQATGAIVLNKVDVIAVHYCHQVAVPTPSRSGWPYRLQVRLAGVLKRLGEKLCFRVNRPGALVCVSDGLAEEIRAHYPALAGRVLTVHNGIDTKTFAPGVRAEDARSMRQELGIPAARLLAVFVGSEWERKGLEPLIRALAQTRDWDLIVVGEGDRRRYRGLADSLGVGAAVHWLGVSSDMQLIYALADAFVLPTSYESFSLVTFEAAASGLPVLATPVSGIRELIEDGHNGCLIGKDPDAIARDLQRLAADPGLRRRLGAQARSSALAFDSEKMVAGYRDLYSRLAQGISR